MIAFKPNPEVNPSLWIGDRFKIPPAPKNSKTGQLGFKKSIFATKTLFQFGLHTHGACKIEHPWSGCSNDTSGFCLEMSKIERHSHHYSVENFRTTHSFVDIVRAADVKKIDAKEEAVIYHVMYYRDEVPISEETDVSKKNDYASIFFPQTIEALKKRNLDLLVNMPTTVKRVTTVDESWIDYKALHKTRNLPHLSSWIAHGYQNVQHSVT